MEIQSINSFLDYLERIRERTNRVIACIPSDRMDWSYAPGKFTFADMIRHLGAIERYMYAENAQRKPSRYPGHGSNLAEGYEAVLAFFARMHEESVSIFRSLSDADLQQYCTTPAGTPIRIAKWLRAMIEHEIHHRGQMYMYLGLLGITTPPIFGLTEEEVVERSNGG